MRDLFIQFVNQFIQNGDIVSFMVYLTLVAILCAVEQYRYYNEVMQTPIQNSNEVS